MDKYEHSNRQYKTTYTSPELRKAQCDVARVLVLQQQRNTKDKWNKYKQCQDATWKLQ